jgi:uncharacterized membrane protein YoaK (UPF0700 family)
MKRDADLICTRCILFATAFAAAAVDIIGFARLGGVFASAMTGNFALLAYHVARGNWHSAVGSIIALAGFVSGCICGFALRRGRTTGTTQSLLLAAEIALLLAFACAAILLPPPAGMAQVRLEISLLALAMGLQAVVGQTVSMSTIVFTTTLTRMLGSMMDHFAGIRSPTEPDIGMQGGVLIAYLCGALLAGVLAVRGLAAVVFLPLGGVALAFVTRRAGRSGQPGA